MSDLTICTRIEHVGGGYVVTVRSPYGSKAGCGFGDVVCPTIDDVLDLIRKADIDPIKRAPKEAAK